LGPLAAYFAVRAPAAVVAAYLFGSHATGRACRESDVDVAVLLEPDLPAGDAFDLRVTLASDLVGVLHTNEVDVLVLNEAPPLLAARVLQEGIRVYCRDEARLRRFARDRLSRAADLRPFLERHEQTLLRALSRRAVSR
jgi:predicted nucleotidyltransferase